MGGLFSCKRGEVGTDELLRVIGTLIIVIAVFFPLFNAVSRMTLSKDFEAAYIAKDNALLIDTLYLVPDDITMLYPLSTKGFGFRYTEGKLTVFDPSKQGIEEITTGSFANFFEDNHYTFNYKELLPRSADLENIEEKDYVVPQYIKEGKEFDVKDAEVLFRFGGVPQQASLCPTIDTSGNIKEAKIVIDPGHDETDKGNTAELEEYRITNDIARSLSKQHSDVNFISSKQSFDTTQAVSIGDRLKTIKAGDIMISIHIGSQSTAATQPLKVYVPTADERSRKLGCLIAYSISNEIQGFAQPEIVSVNPASLKSDDPKKVLDSGKPAAQIEIGSINNKALFDEASDINKIADAIYKGIEQYYSKISTQPTTAAVGAEFSFVVLSDIHEDQSKVLDQILDSIPALNPKFIVLNGDLIKKGGAKCGIKMPDSQPHTACFKQYYDRFKEVADKLGAQILVTPGNHDPKEGSAYLKEGITKADSTALITLDYRQSKKFSASLEGYDKVFVFAHFPFAGHKFYKGKYGSVSELNDNFKQELEKLDGMCALIGGHNHIFDIRKDDNYGGIEKMPGNCLIVVDGVAGGDHACTRGWCRRDHTGTRQDYASYTLINVYPQGFRVCPIKETNNFQLNQNECTLMGQAGAAPSPASAIPTQPPAEEPPKEEIKIESG